MGQCTFGQNSISDVMPAYRDHGTGRRLRNTVTREQGWKQADRRARWGSLQLAAQVNRSAGLSQNTAAEWPKFHREVPCFRSSTHPWRAWVFQPFVRPRLARAPCRDSREWCAPPHHCLPRVPRLPASRAQSSQTTVKVINQAMADSVRLPLDMNFRVAGRVKVPSILSIDTVGTSYDGCRFFAVEILHGPRE